MVANDSISDYRPSIFPVCPGGPSLFRHRLKLSRNFIIPKAFLIQILRGWRFAEVTTYRSKARRDSTLLCKYSSARNIL